MKLADEVKLAMQTFMKMKSSVCESNKGPQDLAPMLHFKYSHLKGYCGVVLAGGHPLQTIPVAWEHIIRDGLPEFVMVMTEAYASTHQKNEPPQNYRKGQMEEDFKNNPCSDVMEIINVHGINIKTGEQYSGMVAFHYDDNGQPVFDEPDYNECAGEALKANIPALFSACRHATLILQKKAI